MDPDLIAAILQTVRETWTLANDIEITMEANPSSVEAGRFTGYRDAGVNRISIGMQALNDTDLRRLGRMHSVSEAKAAYDIARSAFDRVSFDLIYARQDQTQTAWRAELAEALAMEPSHLSLYQLTIEDGTVFGARHSLGQLLGLPDEDRSVALYEITRELCEDAGLPAYEVSNHARDGAQSQHNLIYWRGGDWIGVGPGAHGRVSVGSNRYASEAERRPEAYIANVQALQSGWSNAAQLAQLEIARELLAMGLRAAEGVDLRRVETSTQRRLELRSGARMQRGKRELGRRE
jgi:oxygen-independent coproporphyrinogen-3 oxidase